MITKMKKLLLFMAHPTNDMDDDLTVLGKLGLMHISPFQPAKDDSIERLNKRIEQLEKAIEVLDEYEGAEPSDLVGIIDYAKEERGEIALLEKVLETDRHNRELQKQIAELSQVQQWYSSWGNISLDDIQSLNSRGIYLKLYEMPEKDVKSIQTKANVQVIGQFKGLCQVVLISEDREATLNYHQIDFPGVSKQEVDEAFAKNTEKLATGQQLLLQLSAQKNLLIDALEERNRRLKVRTVQYGGVAFHGKVRCWEGYVPVDKSVRRFGA